MIIIKRIKELLFCFVPVVTNVFAIIVLIIGILLSFVYYDYNEFKDAHRESTVILKLYYFVDEHGLCYASSSMYGNNLTNIPCDSKPFTTTDKETRSP